MNRVVTLFLELVSSILSWLQPEWQKQMLATSSLQRPCWLELIATSKMVDTVELGSLVFDIRFDPLSKFFKTNPVFFQKVNPSRELTYLTLGKGRGDILVPKGVWFFWCWPTIICWLPFTHHPDRWMKKSSSWTLPFGMPWLPAFACGCLVVNLLKQSKTMVIFGYLQGLYIYIFNSMKILKTAVCGSPVTNHGSKVFLHNPATSKSNETSKVSQIARVSQCFGPVSAPTCFFSNSEFSENC